jgi:cellulose synthase/poly-beta-1,6-N-acetylglucosamine synthase-like glycosyltransferase
MLPNIFVITMIAAALLVFHYGGYPLTLVLIRCLTGRRFKSGTIPPLTVSVILPAHNEAPIIRERIANLGRQTVPPLEVLLISDGSTDGTVVEARASKLQQLSILETEERHGKASALNTAAAAARGDILLFTDANARFAEDATAELLRAFADPAVGGASGSLGTAERGGTSDQQLIEASEGFYWRYEALVRQMETDIASTVSAVGPLLALRRESWTPLPPALINDDAYRALDVVNKGQRFVYVSRARCSRTVSRSLGEEGARRRRMAAGRYQLLLNPAWWPWRDPVVLSFWILHKCLRLLSPIFMAIAFAGSLILALSQSWRALGLLLAIPQLIFYGLAFAGLLLPHRSKPPRLMAIAAVFYRINAENFMGLVKYLSSGQSVQWQKASRL